MATGAAERVGGLWGLLETPLVYNAVQRALGGNRFRATVAGEIARVSAEDRVLEPGCGPGNMLAHLPPMERYVGFDPNPRYIAMARERHGTRGAFLDSAVADFPVAESGDPTVVLTVGVLHHLDDADAGRLLDLAARVLVPGGRFIAADPTFIDRQGLISRALVRNDRGQHVRTPARTEALLRSRFSEVRLELRHDLLRLPYSYVMAQASGPIRA